MDPEPVTEKSKSASVMYLYIGTCTNSLREFRERLAVPRKRGRKKKNGTHSRARTYYYANESVDSTSRLTRDEIPRDPEYPGMSCRCGVRQERQMNSPVRHSRDL